MGLWLLPPLLLAAAAVAMLPALRRRFGWGTAGAPRPAGTAAPAPPAPSPPSDPTPEAQAPDSAPQASAAECPAQPGASSGQSLEPLAILRRLRALQFGLPDLPEASGELDRRVTQALAAIGDPAGERRHFPRRPNLLPQLLHAINDENVARRQLVAIIARDPALVDSLLRMANSSFYRVSPQPVESIERAVAILGSDGLRSVIATALMQPIFTTANASEFPGFAQLVWEHALRSAQASVVHAAVVERSEPFAAELLSLISGLAEIVLFRAVREHCAALSVRGSSAATLIAAVIDVHASTLAQRIGTDWQLSPAALAALEEQRAGSTPSSALGRSVRFGRLAGALAVLHGNACIDRETVRLSLPRSGLSAAHTETLLGKLLQPFQDPRTAATTAAARR